MGPDIASFQKTIWAHYREHRRSFAWRDDISPYRVFISEIMLQQTQTTRVRLQFDPFIEKFPDFFALARAPFADVLKLWKGLGYNRRALALKNAALSIVENYHGELPNDPAQLVTLPGIGKATAGSIAAFAFNKPTVFIETNIRTVFINAFFKDQIDVSDQELYPLVERTLDQHAPREWYYALMDYGVMLKKTVGNVSRRSAHYHRQSRFLGSDREIRGKILGALLHHPRVKRDNLATLIAADDTRTKKILDALMREGLVTMDNSCIRIS